MSSGGGPMLDEVLQNGIQYKETQQTNMTPDFEVQRPFYVDQFLQFAENSSVDWRSLYDFDEIAKMHSTILDQFHDDLLNTSKFTIGLITAYSLAFVLGSIGNVSVIFVVISKKQMRTVTNTFLVNLAVADLLVVLVCYPVSLAPYVYRPWIYGNVVCKITPFVQGISVSVSVLTLLAISIDRFYAIYQPMKARLIFSGGRVKAVCLCVWLVSSMVSLPMLFVNSVKLEGVKGIAEILTCRETWNNERMKLSYNGFVLVVLYVMPVLVMFVAYALIGWKLWRTDSVIGRSRSCRGDRPGGSIMGGNRITKERRKIVKMLVLVATIFSVSWLPYHCVMMYLDLNPNGEEIGMVAMYVYPIVQWFSLSNSAINPVCYCLLSKRFQTAFSSCCKRFCCCFCYSLFTKGDNCDSSVLGGSAGRSRRHRWLIPMRSLSGTTPSRDNSRKNPPNHRPVTVRVNGVGAAVDVQNHQHTAPFDLTRQTSDSACDSVVSKCSEREGSRVNLVKDECVELQRPLCCREDLVLCNVPASTIIDNQNETGL